MKESRVLRDRKHVVYNEDLLENRSMRKGIELADERRASLRRGAELPDKENRKRKERSRSSRPTNSDNDGSSSCESDGGPKAGRPLLKRAKSPSRDAKLSPDAIEDSDDDANAFKRFALPGAKPQETVPLREVQGRPARTAAARTNLRLGASTARVNSNDGKRGAGAQPQRTSARGAAAAARKRMQRSVVSASDDESNSDIEMQDASFKGREREWKREESLTDDYEEMEDMAPASRRLARTRAAAEPARAKRPTRGRTRASSPSESEPADSDSAASEEDEDEIVISDSEEGADGGKRTGQDDDNDEVQDAEEDEEDLVPRRTRQTRAAMVPAGRSERRRRKSWVTTDDGEDDENEDEDSMEAPAARRPGWPPKNDKQAKRKSIDADKGKKAKGAGVAKKGKVVTESEEEEEEVEIVEVGASKCEVDPGRPSRPREPVQRVLSYDASTKLFRVKLEGASFRRAAYVTESFLQTKKKNLLMAFRRKGEDYIVEPEWLQIERVIAVRTVSRGKQGRARQMLVKWRGLEYTEATWEWEADLTSEADLVAVQAFDRRQEAVKRHAESTGNPGALRQQGFELPTFRNGRQLRDYQQVSVRWMVNNYSQRRNCILGDEMGLGKTAQSTSTLETLRTVGGVRGPFLIVAPLTTLGHWQREVETWTDMYVVPFMGTLEDRAVIVEHEFYRVSPGPPTKRDGRLMGSPGRPIKFDVLLVSYEMLLKESSLLGSIRWSAAVFDEAHRLKGVNSSTRGAVESMDIDWMLLLTGTPIQNNMLELYSILSLLNPESYPSPEDFTRRFGGTPGGPPPTVEQIKQLQAALAPVLLRRMKEDVEELPQKEEVVIWVELTAPQRTYYRAVYEGQIGALLGGPSAGKQLPQLRNLAMELRKLCCHPVLCDGLEADLSDKLAVARSAAPPDAVHGFSCPELELLVRGSGKMVLLHKLLPKLKSEGRRVLIFSQFVIMLNVLEDYCRLAGFPVERIDGSVTGRARQQAIDRFSADDSGDDGAFVFLLSTRAGGQGITLTAADTVIIYDSDWNPQNDLQAMARCHRIGQKKDVTVYRLISRDTYEMALFSTASKKYGLDEAILGTAGGGADPENDANRITELLRNGAHGLLSDMEAGTRQGEAFAGEDIAQILEGRTERRQIGSRAGNTFSVATFAVDDNPRDGDQGGRRGKRGAANDADYWRSLLPEAAAAHEARMTEGPVVLGPRKRNKVNYNIDSMARKTVKPASDSSDSDEDFQEGDSQPISGPDGSAEDGVQEDGGDGAGEVKGRRKSKGGAGEEGKKRSRKRQGADEDVGDGKASVRPPKPWKKVDVKNLEDKLLGLGPGRWGELFQLMQPCKHSEEEVEEMGQALWSLYETASLLAREQRSKFLASLWCGSDDDMDPLRVLDEDSGGSRAATAAAATGTGAGGGTDGKVQDKPAPAGNAQEEDKVDDYEKKLAAEMEKLPAAIQPALLGRPTILRLMRDAQDAVSHAKSMAEIARIMRAPDGGPLSSRVNGSMRLNYGLPSWWGREEDAALVMAAVQVGFPPRKPRHAVDLALRVSPLRDRVAPPLLQQDGADGDKEQEKDDKDVDKEEGEDKESGRRVEEGGQKSAAAGGGGGGAAPSGGPEHLRLDVWRQLLGGMAKRLRALVTATLDRHRRGDGGGGVASRPQPQPAAKPSRPSLPLTATGTTAAKPQVAPQPQAQGGPVRRVSAPDSPPGLVPPRPQPKQQQPTAQQQPRAVADASAAVHGPQARDRPSAAASQPGGPSNGGKGAPAAGQHHQPAPAPGTSTKPTSGKKQSTLPFVRVDKAKTVSKPTLATGGSVGGNQAVKQGGGGGPPSAEMLNPRSLVLSGADDDDDVEMC